MKIVIIGGGITGLTTALTLHKLGIACKVFEKATSLSEVGAGIMMQPNALTVLDWLNLGKEVRNQGMILEKVEITDQLLKPVRKTKPGFVADQKGNKIVSIHRARLQNVLLNGLPSGMVQFNMDYVSHKNENGKVTIEFSNGREEADLVLAADGINSKVRKNLFPFSSTRYSGQTCWRGIANIQDNKTFHSLGNEAWGKGRRFGFTSISQNEVYWFAVENAPAFQQDNKATLKKDLLEKFSSFHPLIHQLIEQTPDDKIIKNDIYDLKRLPKWFDERICLIGDAAHATTPNMGQGGGQGVEDGYYIGNILAKVLPDHKKAFEIFEKERRKRIDYVVNTSWRFGKMAHHPIGQPILKFLLKMSTDKMMEDQLNKLYSVKTEFNY